MRKPSSRFDQWRDRARPLLIAGIHPNDDGISMAAAGDWEAAAAPAEPATAPTAQLTLPATVMRLLDGLSCFRAAGRYELMYRLAWRILFENPSLLEDAADSDVRNATLMDAAVRRDVHKMHAFVRLREVVDEHGGDAYFAWFEPEHEILHRGTGFFVKRFPNMKWTIATPDGAAVWSKGELNYIDSPPPDSRPAGDAQEDLWRIYYRSICNVARINPVAMRREMPQRYWKNLPESTEIDLLIRDGVANFAARRQQAREGSKPMSKAIRRALSELPAAHEGPQGCRRCGLWQHATQAVVGEGAKDARLVLVGEQPGDEEDLRGRPFVGPAGRMLEEALNEAGLARSAVYITNAVKHFKWEPRGKRRLHKRPDVREVAACSEWLTAEIADIAPTVIVALGATALRALVGSALSVDAARRQELTHASGVAIVPTYHPSAVLRAEGERAADLRAMLVADLRRAGQLAGEVRHPPA